MKGPRVSPLFISLAREARPTSVLVLGAQVDVGEVLQLLRLRPVKLLDVQVLAADGALQLLDLLLQLGHLLLARHRSLDGGNIPVPSRLNIGHRVLNACGNLQHGFTNLLGDSFR